MNTESKIQYILDENKELIEISKDKCKPVEYPIKYKLKNAFEVFVRVDGTENYWISNYGRCVNNLNHKDKNTFFKHKEGKCHYTIFEIERHIISTSRKKVERTDEVFGTAKTEEECIAILNQLQNENKFRKYRLETMRYRRETSPEDLVADTFLVSYRGRCKIWHKDGDYTNNWYKNLLYVSMDDYKKLKAGKITWQELNLEQEYIEYENKASSHAYKI